jgi:hypothetical protein
MYKSHNLVPGRSTGVVGVRRSRMWAKAVLIPLATASAAGLLAASPANASAQGAESPLQSVSSAGIPFTVHGKIPYRPDPLADATTPANASCSTLTKLEALVEAKVAEYSVFPTDARNLLQHWLDGTGTTVALGQNTGVARELLSYPGFVNMNNEVQVYAASRLAQGQTTITLPAPLSPLSVPSASSPLTLLDFSDKGHYPDLYWAFRGTQGLTVSGSGSESNGRYTGKLTYTIYDTYGFGPNGSGSVTSRVTTDMNYLQTHCGWPKYARPRWFSDSFSVTVPFNRPAAS